MMMPMMRCSSREHCNNASLLQELHDDYNNNNNRRRTTWEGLSIAVEWIRRRFVCWLMPYIAIISRARRYVFPSRHCWLKDEKSRNTRAKCRLKVYIYALTCHYWLICNQCAADTETVLTFKVWAKIRFIPCKYKFPGARTCMGIL